MPGTSKSGTSIPHGGPDARRSAGRRKQRRREVGRHDAEGLDAPVKLTIVGAPAAARRLLLRRYRIDRNHRNAYTVWPAMGSPPQPKPEQYARLEQEGQLELLESPTVKLCHCFN